MASGNIIITLPLVSNFVIGKEFKFMFMASGSNTITFNIGTGNQIFKNTDTTILSSITFNQYVYNATFQYSVTNTWILIIYINESSNSILTSPTITNGILTNGILTCPTFKSSTQVLGGVKTAYNTLDNGNKLNIYDENYGRINCVQLNTATANGLGINAMSLTVKIYQASNLISEFTLSSLVSLGLTVKNKVNLLTNTNTIISVSTILSCSLNEFYRVSGTSAFTITLPTIIASNVGSKLTFRRVGGTTTIVITLTGSSCQICYNNENGTSILLGSGVYIQNIVSMYVTTSTFAWFQI